MITPTQQAHGARRFYEIQKRTGRESVSGPGSFIASTEEIRRWLPVALRELGVRVLADVPCGDHHWMSQVELPCAYVGYDIVEELVEQNRQRYPQRAFYRLNAIEQRPMDCDAVLCRDLLVHLTYDHAAAAIANFRAAGAKWLICTTFPGVENRELVESHGGWGWRPLDMEAAPFLLGPAIDGVREVVAGETWERWARVYQL